MEKAGCCSTVRRVENLSLRADSHDVRSGYVKRLWGGLPLPLPLGEVATRSVDGEGRHVKKICRWHIQAVEKVLLCVVGIIPHTRPCGLVSLSKKPVIASQSADWRGNPFPKPPLCKGRWQKSLIFDGGVVHYGDNPPVSALR